jgi:tetratricopeptide (TPR) repeat protein
VVNAPMAQGGLRFSHDLGRRAIYDELSSPRRALLHRKVAAALEHLRPDDAALAAALAHHYCQAGAAEPAAAWALRASADALRAHAYDDAVRLARRSLDENLQGQLRGDQRSDLLIATAEGEWRRGSRAAALDAILEAAQISLAEGDVARLSAAALAVPWTPADPHPQLVNLLELSLALLPQGDSETRARLLARLAWERWYSKPTDEVDDLGREAVAMARRIGDGASLANALTFVAMLPGCEFRFEADGAEELESVARQVDDAESLRWAHVVRIQACVARGDLAGIHVQIAQMEELSDLHRSVRYRWFATLWTGMLALVQGHLDDVEPLATTALELGETAHQVAARTNFTLQLVQLRWAQGRHAETIPLLETAIATGPSYSVPRWRAWLAVALCETGRWDQARETYSSVQPADVGRDIALAVFAGLAEACVALDDIDRAPELYQLLVPTSGHLVVNGGYSASSYGPADRLLGRLAALQGRWDVAIRHLTTAHTISQRLQTPMWELDALVDLAAIYLDRDQTGDAATAVTLLNEADRLLGSLTTAAQTSRITALRSRAQALPGTPVHLLSRAIRDGSAKNGTRCSRNTSGAQP